MSIKLKKQNDILLKDLHTITLEQAYEANERGLFFLVKGFGIKNKIYVRKEAKVW